MNLRPKPPPPPELNLTPLVDVVFLLLLFFMISTSFKQERELPIALPQTEGQPTAAPQTNALVVLIDRDSQYVIAGQALRANTKDDLTSALTRALNDMPAEIALLRIEADAATPHQAVMRVLDAAQALGVTRLVFSTQRPATDTPSP